MSEENKTFGNIQIGQASGSIIGQYIENANINRGSKIEKEQKTKEELIQDILKHFSQYTMEIDQLEEIDEVKREEAIHAVMQVRAELKKQQPDEQKIKSIWEPIQKTSYIAAICSAISDLVQLIK